MTTSVSVSGSRGVSFTKMSDFTVSTSAPGAGDFEFRYNLTDSASPTAGTMKDIDLILFLRGVIRQLIASTSNVDVLPTPPL